MPILQLTTNQHARLETEVVSVEQAAATAAAVMALGEGAVRGHRAAAIELAESYCELGAAEWPLVKVRVEAR